MPQRSQYFSIVFKPCKHLPAPIHYAFLKQEQVSSGFERKKQTALRGRFVRFGILI
jgi:hypothetical protein